MMRLPFIKMHGCGNDYVFIDGMDWDAPRIESFDSAAVAQQVSDRHRGIGSDGLVLILPATDPADARMKMFNADGSEGALCGNALRCMAMWLHQSGHCGAQCQIAMQDRIITAEILNSDPGAGRAVVRVTIGRPMVLNPAAIGMMQHVRQVQLPDVLMEGQPLQLLETSMGNPHAVIFVDQLDSVDFFKLGPLVERHAKFPNRINVEFVQVTSRSSATVRVWERGSGETLACGSGACAVTVAGLASGQFVQETPVQISMRGGVLTVRMTSDRTISLEGAAEESFRGEIQYLES